MMIKEGSTKSIDFMTPGTGGLVLRHTCNYMSYSENASFL